MAEKEYVGKGRSVGQYGNVSFSVCVDTIAPHIFDYKGKKYIKLMMGVMKNPDEHGKTHTVYIDDFKPDPSKRRDTPQTSQNAPQQAEAVGNEQINPEDIPF